MLLSRRGIFIQKIIGELNIKMLFCLKFNASQNIIRMKQSNLIFEK